MPGGRPGSAPYPPGVAQVWYPQFRTHRVLTPAQTTSTSAEPRRTYPAGTGEELFGRKAAPVQHSRPNCLARRSMSPFAAPLVLGMAQRQAESAVDGDPDIARADDGLFLLPSPQLLGRDIQISGLVYCFPSHRSSQRLLVMTVLGRRPAHLPRCPPLQRRQPHPAEIPQHHGPLLVLPRQISDLNLHLPAGHPVGRVLPGSARAR